MSALPGLSWGGRVGGVSWGGGGEGGLKHHVGGECHISWSSRVIEI